MQIVGLILIFCSNFKDTLEFVNVFR